MTNDRQFVANLPFLHIQNKNRVPNSLLLYICTLYFANLLKQTMDSTKIVGEKIKSLRETKEISVAELAVRSGLAEEQIERIENNVDLPSLAPLIKIARALGVRLGTFLDDQEEQGAVICRKQESEDTISFSNNAMDLRTHMQLPTHCQNQKRTGIWNHSS